MQVKIAPKFTSNHLILAQEAQRQNKAESIDSPLIGRNDDVQNSIAIGVGHTGPWAAGPRGLCRPEGGTVSMETQHIAAGVHSDQF